MSQPGDRSEPARGISEVQLFCVQLLGARYAVEAGLVTEVVRLGPLTRLPAAPPFLPGVFNQRGEVLAAIDIHGLVDQPAIPAGPATRAASARCGGWKVAVITEGIEGLISVPAHRVEPPPGTGTGIAEFLSGVTRDPKGPVALLDLPRLVESARARSVAA